MFCVAHIAKEREQGLNPGEKSKNAISVLIPVCAENMAVGSRFTSNPATESMGRATVVEHFP